jgi:hypothetical protein
MNSPLNWSMHSFDKAADTKLGKKSVGLRVPKRDRQKYILQRTPVVLHLLYRGGHTKVTIPLEETFWTLNGELTHAAIRKWVDTVYGLKNWEPSPTRPKVLVWPLGKQCFAVVGLDR